MFLGIIGHCAQLQHFFTPHQGLLAVAVYKTTLVLEGCFVNNPLNA